MAADPDGISLVSLEVWAGDDELASPPSAGSELPSAAGSGNGYPTVGVSLDLQGEGDSDPNDTIALELDDHRTKPASTRSASPSEDASVPKAPSAERPQASATSRAVSSPSPASSSRGWARGLPTRLAPASLDAPSDEGVPESIGSSPIAPIGTEASAAVAALLQGETGYAPDPTERILLAPPPAVGPTVVARNKTMTAALPPGAGVGVGAQSPRYFPLGLERRGRILALTAVAAVGTVGALAFSDLAERVRGEPAPAEVLRAVADGLARDDYPAYAEGARLLEDAVAKRRRAPRTRAAAAELLAQSIVLHGADRARAARGKALLEVAVSEVADAPVRLARPLAWMALATGHARDAETLAGAATVAPADRAILLGFVALDRGDPKTAAARFAEAARASPEAAPSLTAVNFALALAREAEGSSGAENAYRAVLAQAPSHLGAALGLARLSGSLTARARVKLATSALTAHAQVGARAELATGFVLVALTARQIREPADDSGDAASAEAAVQRARALDGGNPVLAAWTGDALLREGRYDEAIIQYRRTVKLPLGVPAMPILGFARAAALLESGRSNEARAALVELARRVPGDARSSFWLGRIAERLDPPDLATAEHRYREALMRDAQYVPAALALARLLLDGHRSTEALETLKRAEAHGASTTMTRLALGRAQLAAGNARAAAATFRQILAATPPSGSAPSDGGGAAGARASSGATARLALSAALEAMGDLSGAYSELVVVSASGGAGAQSGLGTRMASVLVRLGRRDEALAAYERDIASGGATPATRVAAARLALAMGRKDRARALVTSVVDEDPRTPGALLVLAEISRAEGNPVQAIAELRRALAVDGSPEVQLEFGRGLAALGRDEEALAALAEAQSIPAAGVERGRLLVRRADFEGAVRELRAALAKLPSSADGFLILGIAQDRLGRAPEAEAAWRQAVRLVPTLAEAHYRLGKLAMDRGQSAAALGALRVAAEHLPAELAATDGSWRVDLYFQLGFAEKRRGSGGRAEAAFRRYLELAPPDAPARNEAMRELAAAQIR